jgi:hypothetical protein
MYVSEGLSSVASLLFCFFRCVVTIGYPALARHYLSISTVNLAVLIEDGVHGKVGNIIPLVDRRL